MNRFTQFGDQLDAMTFANGCRRQLNPHFVEDDNNNSVVEEFQTHMNNNQTCFVVLEMIIFGFLKFRTSN